MCKKWIRDHQGGTARTPEAPVLRAGLAQLGSLPSPEPSGAQRSLPGPPRSAGRRGSPALPGTGQTREGVWLGCERAGVEVTPSPESCLGKATVLGVEGDCPEAVFGRGAGIPCFKIFPLCYTCTNPVYFLSVSKFPLVTQSCLTLCDPMDCTPPGSSVHGIFQARILECVAISFSRGYS